MVFPKNKRKPKTVMELRLTSQHLVESSKDNNLSHRVVILGSNEGFADNVSKTSRFTAATFLPKCLYELLHPTRRFANFYFLLIGFMQMVPPITITDGMPIQWLPLMLILAVDMTVMGVEVREAPATAACHPPQVTTPSLRGETIAALRPPVAYSGLTSFPRAPLRTARRPRPTR